MKYREFAERLKAQLIEKLGEFTQQEAGKLLGVSQPTINSWLNGEAMPGMPKAIATAKKLDCCVEYLLTGNGPKQYTIDLTDETHSRILQALKLAKATIENDGSLEAKKYEVDLYRLAVDRAMVGEVSEGQLSVFLQALVNH